MIMKLTDQPRFLTPRFLILLDSLYSSTVLLELLTIKNVFLKLEQMSYLFESHQFLR